MDLKLAGKNVLVTGASKGIGLATVRAFLAEGAQVTAVARSSSPDLDSTDARFVAADLASADGPSRMMDAVLATDPRLDVLVNNVGGGNSSDEALADIFGGTDSDWEETYALNLFAAVRTSRSALPALIGSRGCIVNVGSEAAQSPHTASLPYASAKAALAAFSRGLADKVGPKGVRVNVVTPSATRTPLLTSADGPVGRTAARTGRDLQDYLSAIPARGGMTTGRLIEPEEIALAIVVLASPAMPSALGSNWSVHGGAVKAIF